jgi:hypothetical protein
VKGPSGAVVSHGHANNFSGPDDREPVWDPPTPKEGYLDPQPKLRFGTLGVERGPRDILHAKCRDWLKGKEVKPDLT